MKIVGTVSASSKWPEFSWRKLRKPQPMTFRGAVADPTCMPKLQYDELMDFEFADVVPRQGGPRAALARVTLKANQYTLSKEDRVVGEVTRVPGVWSIQDEKWFLKEVLYGFDR